MIVLRILLVVVLVLCVGPTALFAEELRISVQLQPKQRDKFERVFNQFYKETGIQVKAIVEGDLGYKLKMPVWLLEGKDTPDVLYWCSSQRLFFYADKGLILPITGLWEEQEFDKHFSHVKQGVTRNGEVYAIPFAYYHWGLYYRKSMVDKFGGKPDDWESFLNILARMKKAGITPIGLGSKEHWPAAAWFDYINLRTNGLGFHLQLLNGEISFNDQRVQNVLHEWKKLVDGGFYNENNELHTWDGVLPNFYRNKIGFLLLGNFVASKWPTWEPVMKDIGFMPFPRINENLPNYENAPTDVFFIAKSTDKVEEAKAFIRFIARPDVQSSLNEELGYIPPHREATAGDDRFIQAGHSLLSQADALAQYFDRDTPPAFDKIATPLLAEFVNTGNVEKLTRNLENGRARVFGPVYHTK